MAKTLVNRNWEKWFKKLTKIDKIYQDSENPVIHNGPKSSKIVPVSHNESEVTQDLPNFANILQIWLTGLSLIIFAGLANSTTLHNWVLAILASLHIPSFPFLLWMETDYKICDTIYLNL